MSWEASHNGVLVIDNKRRTTEKAVNDEVLPANAKVHVLNAKFKLVLR